MSFMSVITSDPDLSTHNIKSRTPRFMGIIKSLFILSQSTLSAYTALQIPSLPIQGYVNVLYARRVAAQVLRLSLLTRLYCPICSKRRSHLISPFLLEPSVSYALVGRTKMLAAIIYLSSAGARGIG